MIHDLKKQGLSISSIARKTGLDRKTVRKYLDKGLEVPSYGPRPGGRRLLDDYRGYLVERLDLFPGLSAKRLHREVRELGFSGAYSTLTEYLRLVRPAPIRPFERRFETPPGEQAQIDFAEFTVTFTDEPAVTRKVWLFSYVLGHSRFLWGQFCSNQQQDAVLRCHIAAFESCGGACRFMLYDRMKTAVLGEDASGVVRFNPTLVALLDHYGVQPQACKPYRAKTKGKVERPFRYIRQDFFLGRTFKNLADLNAQFSQWRDQQANARVHATTNRIVKEAFEEERPFLLPLPALPWNAVLSVERRITRDGMVSFNGNLYSVPQTDRRRPVEVQSHPEEIRIYEKGQLIASHPVLEGKNQRRIDPCHRKQPLCPRVQQKRQALRSHVSQRSLAFYEAAGQRMAKRGERP